MGLEEFRRTLSEIDKIEDDEEFCRAEYNAVLDYCVKKDFGLSEEEMAIIRSRALDDSLDNWKEGRSLK